MGSIKSVLLDFELDDFFISVSMHPFRDIPFMPSTYKLVALLVVSTELRGEDRNLPNYLASFHLAILDP